MAAPEESALDLKATRNVKVREETKHLLWRIREELSRKWKRPVYFDEVIRFLAQRYLEEVDRDEARRPGA